MRRLHWLIFLLASISASHSYCQEEDPVHDELRALRDELIEAVNANDVERLEARLHEQVIVTWLNGEVSRGPEEVRAYYDRMMLGDSPVVESITVNPTVERLSDIYEDTAVAYGASKDRFNLTNGLDFEVASRWSATLRKSDGEWLIVNFHSSTNIFDNPLLNMAKQTMYWGIGLSFVAGGALVAGISIVRNLRRKNA